MGGSTTNAPYIAKAERAIRPVAIAIGVFGLIAALATLVINGQVISRLIRRNAPEAAIVRALGAGPAMVMADGVLGVLGAIGAGSVLAVGVAMALSPLAPIGPVRPVYPDIGVSFDWTVLGFGFLLVRRGAHGGRAGHRPPGGATPIGSEAGAPCAGSRLAPGAVAVGLPPSAALGIRSALGSRSGRGTPHPCALHCSVP